MQYGWGRGAWFDAVAAEHRATREAVTVVDDLVRQDSGAGPRCRAGVAAARANDIAVPVGRTVYTGILNARHLRERPHDRPAGARQIPDHHRLGPAGARHGLARPQRRRRRARHADRRDRRMDRAVGDGPEEPRAAAEGEPRRLLQRGAFPLPPSARSASATAPCWPRAAPTWASWAGSFTCRPSSPSPCSRPCTRPAPSSACATPATTPSNAAPGEGLSRLGPRADARRHAVPGRASAGR